MAYAALALVVTGGSIALALTVTPYSRVSTAGQTVSVGASAPSLSWSGPGELDLFGQQLPTTVRFDGPVRPRLVLTRITLDSQLASVFTGGGGHTTTTSLGRSLASGWVRYFLWEAVVAAGCAALLIGALAGWWRLGWRRTLALLSIGVVVVEAVNLGAVMLAAYGAPGRLSHVTSLEALVGRAPLTAAVPAGGPASSGHQAVVIGDSTAAGLGNPLVDNPTPLDRACGRSVDSYAADLGTVNGWNVLNLACSGATIPTGLLGPQQVGSLTAPAQVAVAEQAKGVSVVIVSIGANDVGWASMLEACAAATACNNSAFTAYFQQQLSTFTTSYLQLLQQLSAFPSHPAVIVNLYYDPFDTSRKCLSKVGLDPPKEKTVVAMLDALNGVLSKGAGTSSFSAVQPDFAGHALCDPAPYVQGIHGAAPFHPTAAGELAIALADEHALTKVVQVPSGQPGGAGPTGQVSAGATGRAPAAG